MRIIWQTVRKITNEILGVKKTGNPLTRDTESCYTYFRCYKPCLTYSASTIHVYFLSVDRKEKFESLNQSWLILDRFHSKAMKRKEDLLAL